MPTKVAVRDLAKRYGAVEAARGVSFEIQAGEIFGLIGPNGAGKTTTLECVLGLRQPDRGSITVCGIDARERPQDVKQKIGAALQTTALQDKITPREALSLFASFYEHANEPAALLDRFGLTDKADAAFDTLSGGQRQRLALALAFVNRPELVFLDEPTTGLDPHSRRELHGDIIKMKADGQTVLLTTHDMREAETLCDRIAIIDEGRIIATGTARELINKSRALPLVSFDATRPLDKSSLTSLPGAQDASVSGTTGRFRTSNLTKAVAELMLRLDSHGAALTDLHVQKATLEDVFVELTSSAKV